MELVKKKKVDETTDLLPITDYNKTKMIGEKLVLNYSHDFKTTILRPGTVCGFSKNLRLDLTVNAMTFSALKYKVVNVNGGSQIRPQLHINEMINCYLFCLEKKITGIFNVGFENFEISEVAKMIKESLPNIKIKRNSSIDVRSYRLYAGKILSKGYVPIYKTKNAIFDIIRNHKFKKYFNKSTSYRSLFLSSYIK